ncbi:glycoprotein endo-alpha-1,2-mannosidase-like [Littorina saxatilis]|uniref:Uncharacterized protein n=1 Tax=Littorina saxatilis TaxID=31220 RepID=A0AAN9BLL4_9CAEN
MARGFKPMPPSVRRYLMFLFIVCVTSVVSVIIYFLSERDLLHVRKGQNSAKLFEERPSQNLELTSKLQEAATLKTDNRRDDKLTGSKLVESSKDSALNYNVHLFYYPWYGNPETDGRYVHWNHQYLPHWRKEEMRKWPLGVHVPPDDIGANFYPALGPYSSADPDTVDKHMAQVQSSGAGVIVVSWYPPGQADENGKPFDSLIPLILDKADKHGVKVAIHIEPYKNRSGETLKQHVKYVVNTYGKHPGLYRRQVGGRHLPVFYIYDSYQVDSASWAQALKPEGRHSLRGTDYDGIFLGLYLNNEDEHRLLTAGFDGFYTYFAANGFTRGSSWSNWKAIADFARKNQLLFVPSVGPGYVDTRVRPWNALTTRKRLQGQYFRQALQSALDAKVGVVSVTSFNEWHEGTQIEAAVPKTISGFKYEDYAPRNPDFYLHMLKEYVDKFAK